VEGERHPRALFFEDARVPKENVLGPVGDGFVNFLKTLDGAAFGIAALSLGIAEGAYEAGAGVCGHPEAVREVHRQLPGDPLHARRSRHGHRDGDHLLYTAAHLKQAKRPFKKEAAMAKLFCSELAMKATTQAVQIFGGYGYTTEYPVERMMRERQGLRDRGRDERDPAHGHRRQILGNVVS